MGPMGPWGPFGPGINPPQPDKRETPMYICGCVYFVVIRISLDKRHQGKCHLEKKMLNNPSGARTEPGPKARADLGPRPPEGWLSNFESIFISLNRFPLGCIFRICILLRGLAKELQQIVENPDVRIWSIVQWFGPTPHRKSMQQNTSDALERSPDLYWGASIKIEGKRWETKLSVVSLGIDMDPTAAPRTKCFRHVFVSPWCWKPNYLMNRFESTPRQI